MYFLVVQLCCIIVNVLFPADVVQNVITVALFSVSAVTLHRDSAVKNWNNDDNNNNTHLQ